jgi:flagellar hook assembly protein FlgD
VPAGAPLSPRLALESRNPTSGRARFRFELAAPAAARLDVYDVTGRLVRTLYRGGADRGSHRIEWDGQDGRGIPVAAGIYLVRLESAGAIATLRFARTR